MKATLSRATANVCLIAGLAAIPLTAAKSGFERMSAREAQRELAGLTQQESTAAMYIWSDKYVYRPGEQLTLRGTLKPNDDLFPYTMVAYIVNNQTGVKTFLPCATEAPCDITGAKFEDGFRISKLPALNKQVLVGSGGLMSSSPLTIPSDLGMHTIVVEMRDYTGTRIMKSAYQKIGVVDGEVSVSGDISTNTTWSNTKLYRLTGITFVKGNSTLTIEPGTFVIGNPGTTPPTALVITRGSRISAEGTRSRPIIMTSSRPFGERAPQDWGGLILLGAATINTPGGTESVEGLPPTADTNYGGTDDNSNCGSLKYVRVEFAGAPFQPNQEVNSFTWGGCGLGTKSEFLQAHYGFDDSFEWFGGNIEAKYLVATYGRDDAFDWQNGTRLKLQFGLAYGNDDLSNMGIEADNNANDNSLSPVANGDVQNVTFVGAGARGADETNVAAVFLRRGTRATLNNIIAMNWANFALRVVDSLTLANLTDGNIKANGFLMWDNGTLNSRPNTIEGQVEAGAVAFANGTSGQGKQFVVADPMLTRPFERSDPDFRPRIGSPVFRPGWVKPAASSFFDQSVNYIGAFGDVNWAEEWTTFLQEQDIKP